MKVIAMYLPQFYQVKENEEWWGEGFTDWVSTRQAEPLFDGHYQPHVPLNKNYYDMMDHKTMDWQSEVMRRYGVDGVCMYHYWFKDGRRILEKPAENLLRWKEINMPFCFCWANETWARSWSKIKGNIWSNLSEPKKTEGEKEVLLEQCYGEKEQWKIHFEYLLPFFEDPRYIKIEGKPLFVFYKAQDIPCLEEMILYWKRLAVEAGLNGLYFIGGNVDSSVTLELDAELIHEPGKSFRKLIGFRAENYVFTVNYEDVWKQILNSVPNSRKTYFGGFIGYDDTPRRGVEGVVVQNVSPELFGHFLTELMAKNAVNGSEIVFINAWNEWGEGMHLEPDEKYGNAFLECIQEAKSRYQDKKAKYLEIQSTDALINEVIRIQKECDKFEKYLNVLDQWMKLREKDVRIDGYLKKKGYERVCVYGYGIFGQHLIEELEDSSVDIMYIIDRQKDKLHVDYPVYLPTETLPECDVIVITSFYFLSEIKKALEVISYPKISIETVINELSL